MLRPPHRPEAVTQRFTVPAAKPDPALRDRFEQLLGAGRTTSRPERGSGSANKAADREESADVTPEGEGANASPGLVPIGAEAFRALLSGDAGSGDGLSVLAGPHGMMQLVAPSAAEAAAASAPQSADPAMMQLAERIASLHLPPSGTYQIMLPGHDRIAARVEHAGQGGFTIALHLPTRAVEHRRRLAAELAMHLDARGLTRCVVRLEDDPPAG